MAADGNGNLFVGDINGNVINSTVSSNVLFKTNFPVTTMTYYAPTNTLYIGDFGGNVTARSVLSGQNLGNCTTVQVSPVNLFVSNISLMSLN